MGKSENLIFSGIFSRDDVVEQLTAIFHDSIVLDLKHEVLAIHDSIVRWLHLDPTRIIGRNVRSLVPGLDTNLRLKLLLSQGAFQHEPMTLSNGNGHCVQFHISGFNLGLVSDINRIIILQLVPSDIAKGQHTTLDDFIYRAAHDLRGPLATIKGLVNLLQIRPADEESQQIIRLLDLQADKLDERLFELSYLSGVTRENKQASLQFDITDIETSLRNVIVRNAFVDIIDFRFEAPGQITESFDIKLINALSVNILQFILTLPVNDIATCISFSYKQHAASLVIRIAFSGFIIDAATKAGIAQQEFLYTDLISYPRLLNYFTARKVAADLNAAFRFTAEVNDTNSISIEIPPAKEV